MTGGGSLKYRVSDCSIWCGRHEQYTIAQYCEAQFAIIESKNKANKGQTETPQTGVSTRSLKSRSFWQLKARQKKNLFY